MGRKEQLITEIRVGLSVLGKSIDEVNAETKGFFRKKIADLEPIAKDVENRLRAAGKLKARA